MRSLVADAVRGLNYLHKHVNITHGDVKAANMVVDASCTVLKLCDFGLAGRGCFVLLSLSCRLAFSFLLLLLLLLRRC